MTLLLLIVEFIIQCTLINGTKKQNVSLHLKIKKKIYAKNIGKYNQILHKYPVYTTWNSHMAPHLVCDIHFMCSNYFGLTSSSTGWVQWDACQPSLQQTAAEVWVLQRTTQSRGWRGGGGVEWRLKPSTDQNFSNRLCIGDCNFFKIMLKFHTYSATQFDFFLSLNSPTLTQW